MKILLASNAMYEPPRGGSTRSNLAWLRELTAAGHECRVVCPAPADAADDVVVRNGITIARVHDLARRPDKLSEAIRQFDPDWVLVSSEDLSHVLLREAHKTAASRLVYLAHTPQFAPFGPESWNPDAKASELVRQARAVVVIGHHMADYVRRHLGRDAHVIHPPIYGAPPYPLFGSPDSGDVLMINPSAVKGLAIFAGLARRFPDVPFAALAGWGTTSQDRRLMSAIPNLRVLESVPDIDEVLKNTRVLVMPSVWYEGLGLIVIEAMLRGVPVIASDSGGLKEAKGPTKYVVPVRPVEKYEHAFDEAHMPRPIVPEQDLEPWVDALNELLSDREAYQAEAARSRAYAEQFIAGIGTGNLESLLQSLGTASPMRILLAHNSLYYPSWGGGDKSNRLLMEALAARGHSVLVCSRIEVFGSEGHDRLARDLAGRGVTPRDFEPGGLEFELGGVHVRTLTRSPLWRSFFAQQIAAFDPDIIITSTDDPAQILLDLALEDPRARVVHLIRATVAVAFGPHSAAINPERTEKLRRADCVVGVSESVAQYAREHGQMDAIHVPISLMERREFPRLGRFENSYITMVNPCAVKGVGIFAELARQMPDQKFAAVPTWGTNAQDYALLHSLPNVDILPGRDNIDELFDQSKIFLVPSVWAEARSRVVVEAMARGIPVLASNIGGLPEAKLGVPYLLPINPVERYNAQLDENMVPVADVPPQDISPWQQALERLVTDRAHWEEIAEASFNAANNYLARLTVEPFESLLFGLRGRPKKNSLAVRTGRSTERERLLAIRIRKHLRTRADSWFPGMVSLAPEQTRILLLPFAGGGALAWSGWQDALGRDFCVTPVRLPGRENRLSEPAFRDMGDLVRTLSEKMEPLLAEPFILYGHSMGAIIAFELTRELRRRGKPLPRLLAVSGARAPQFRLNHTPRPTPSDDELIAEVRSLGGLTEEQLSQRQVVDLLLPSLRADTYLYQHYRYQPEPPLAVPIIAYGGSQDSHVLRSHLDAWREQTTEEFTVRIAEGGHFFIRSPKFPPQLAEDLGTLLAREALL